MRLRTAIARVAAIAFLALLPLPAGAIGSSGGELRREAPRAERAVLDLSDWDFQRDGAVKLAGDWAFFPGRLLDYAEATASIPPLMRTVPDFWKGTDAGGTAGRGAGTYRLRVLLSDRAVGLGIRLPTVSTAFELDANGAMIAAAGRPALLAQDAIPDCFTGLRRVPDVDASPIASAPRELDLVVRVSNHNYRQGGMWSAFLLGPEDGLAADKRLEDGLTLAFFGTAFATAVVFFIFFRYRRRDFGNLFFAAFAMIIALRTLVTGDYLLAALLPSLPFGALIRLSYLCAFASYPLCALFFGSLFPEEIGPKARKLACAPFCVLGLSLAAPLPLLTRSIYVLYPLLVAVMIPWITVCLVRAARRRRPGSVAMLAMCILLAAAAISDMLSSSLILRFANALYPVLVVFIFVQASILARRFSAAFDSVERLSGELARANEGLDTQVMERTRELEDAYERIKGLSIKDPLTGAFNRRYLDMELVREVERALRYGLPLSLLFCDLDHFKAINDRYGHGTGDDVLRAFSRIVFTTIRGNIDWFARFGGEEFLVVVPGTRSDDAAILAERLRAEAEAELVESESRAVSFTLSIGVAGLEGGSSTEADGVAAVVLAEKLVARADEAMYVAKERGRNRVELGREDTRREDTRRDDGHPRSIQPGH